MSHSQKEYDTKTFATRTGLEPATSAVTGRRANQLRYRALKISIKYLSHKWLLCHLQSLYFFKSVLLVLRAPNGIRTRVTAVKGRCPRPLDDGDVSRLRNLTCDCASNQTAFIGRESHLFKVNYEPIAQRTVTVTETFCSPRSTTVGAESDLSADAYTRYVGGVEFSSRKITRPSFIPSSFA